jgi:small nuclear ribonucleoprotein (snRNP)-like protein
MPTIVVQVRQARKVIADTKHNRRGFGRLVRYSQMPTIVVRVRQARKVIADTEDNRRRFGRLVRYSQMPNIIVEGLAEAQGFCNKLN